MDSTGSGFGIAEGTEVFGSDGGKVGSVVEVRPGYLVVEKGFFFPTDYYVPTSAVSGTQEGRVTLNVTKDAALNQGWDAVPADNDGEAMSAYETGTAGPSSVDATAAGGLAGAADAVGEALGTTARTVGAGETVTVPLREEELTATTTAGERGAVRIEKSVVSEERVLSVPVTEERVRVERHVVDRPVEAGDTAFQDEVIEVPVYGEDVRLQTTVRVAEEVEVGKEAVRLTRDVVGTVRHEEVRITDTVEGGAAGVAGEGAVVIDPTLDLPAGGRATSS